MSSADRSGAVAGSGGPVGLMRATHRYAFRSGEWAALVGTMDAPETGRRCYAVKFPDGATDWWPVDDKDAGYEFSEGDVPPGWFRAAAGNLVREDDPLAVIFRQFTASVISGAFLTAVLSAAARQERISAMHGNYRRRQLARHRRKS